MTAAALAQLAHDRARAQCADLAALAASLPGGDPRVKWLRVASRLERLLAARLREIEHAEREERRGAAA